MRRMVRDWHGAEPEFVGNVATEYGNFNEPGAIVDYRLQTGNDVAPGEFHKRGEWAGATPDGLIGADGLLEVKCPFGKRDGGAFKTLAEQPHYAAQVQFQLWVTGRDWCHFWQWSPANAVLETVLQDAEWQAVNIPKLEAFWQRFMAERDNPLHLEPLRAEIDTPFAVKLVSEYDDLTEAMERADARRKEVLAEMVALAGDKSAIFAGRNLTSVTKAGAVSYAKALATYAPGADLEPFRGKPSSYWLFK